MEYSSDAMKIIEKSTSDDYALDVSQGDMITFCVTAEGNFTLSAENFDVGNIVYVSLMQDSTGSRTVTLSSNFLWTGGSAPTLTTSANAVDKFVFMSSGTKLEELSRALDVK